MSALIPLGSVHAQEKWSDELLTEYLNGVEFRPYMRFGELKNNAMGDASRGVISVIDALGRKAGDKINIPLRRALAGTGVTGDQRLEGQEEEMVFDNESITIDLLRHATILRNVYMSEQRTAFEIFEEARPALSEWSEEKLNEEIVAQLTDTSAGRVQSRYLYGNSEANWNATHTTALANVDDTNDRLTVRVIRKVKDKAVDGDPSNGVGRIRPASMEMSNGAMKKNFVMFMPLKARRHLELDPEFQNIQLNINEANTPKLVDTSNFVGTIDGIMCQVIEGMSVLPAVGAGSIDVAPVALCGAQAIAVVYGQRPFFTQQDGDYGAEMGVAVNEIRDVKKLAFNSANYAVINLFVSGTGL